MKNSLIPSNIQLPKTLGVENGERVVNAVTIAGVGYLGLTYGVPFATKSMWSLAALASSGISLAWSAAGLVFIVYSAPHVWKLCRMMLDSLAERLTYRVIGYDPVARLGLWHQEVVSDGAEFASQIAKLAGVIELVEDNKSDALARAEEAENTAMQLGENDPSFGDYAYEAEVYRGQYSEYGADVVKLETISAELGTLYQMYQSEAHQIKVDIDSQRSKWKVSGVIEGATGSAEKLLLNKSDIRQHAETAEKIITERHAEALGRMKNLKTLSGGMVKAYQGKKSASAEKLLSKWNNEKLQLEQM